MALTAALRGSTGNIECNVVIDQGVYIDFAAFAALISSHSHSGDTLTSNAHAESYVDLPMLTSGSTFPKLHVATSDAGAGKTYQLCSAQANRSHTHIGGTLAVSGTTASTALSPKTDNQIIVASNGEVTCDLIDGYCPFVLYDKYDGHYHSLSGIWLLYEFPPITVSKRGDTSYCYFEVATDSDGADAEWRLCQTHGNNVSSQHNHTIGTLALAAYSAPAGSQGAQSGDPKFKIEGSTGNIYLKHDVNDIGIKKFYTDYLAHVHGSSGASGSYGPTDSQVFSTASDSYCFFHTDSDTWVEMYVNSAAHTHSVVMS